MRRSTRQMLLPMFVLALLLLCGVPLGLFFG